MLPTASGPARFGAAKVTPEAIPEAFVISLLPPPAPSSRTGPLASARPRSVPPPLPDMAKQPVAALRTPTLAWDLPQPPTPGAPDESQAAAEDARMVRALRGSARWGNALDWLRTNVKSAFVTLSRSWSHVLISKRVAIGLASLSGVLLCGLLIAKPWAHSHHVARAKGARAAHVSTRAHASTAPKAAAKGGARHAEAARHAKPAKPGAPAHWHAVAPASKARANKRNAVASAPKAVANNRNAVASARKAVAADRTAVASKRNAAVRPLHADKPVAKGSRRVKTAARSAHAKPASAHARNKPAHAIAASAHAKHPIAH